MKRLAIILVILGLASLDSQAQWYLFPGNKKKNTPERTETARADFNKAEPGLTPVEAGMPAEDAPSAECAPSYIPEITRIAAVLPFNFNSGAPAGNYLNFYSGMLLAIREYGLRGHRIEVQVVDSESPLFNEEVIRNSDIVIGPVSPKDYSRFLPLCREGSALVSPLDPRVESVADYSPVIQCPVNQDIQTEDLCNWISEDLRENGASLVVIEESGAARGHYSDKLKEMLGQKGIGYRTVSYGILEGLSVGQRFESLSLESGKLAFVIASENEAFLGDAVRNVRLLKLKGYEVSLYGTSKLKSFSTIDSNDFHDIGLKMTATYFVDYENPEVKSFVLAYRALCNCEPESFAFCGYDTARFCLDALYRFGGMWSREVGDASFRGLQSDFSFRSSNSGKKNISTRRVVFNPDYSITVISR